MTPDDAALLPHDDSREYTATGFGDADEVTLAVANTDWVDIDNQIVTFDTDEDNGDYTADFHERHTATTISNVTVDGTTFPGISAGGSVSVDADSEVSFTLDGTGHDESVVPVVYVADDDGDLPTDADGDPLNDFGVGGEVRFVSDVTLDLEVGDSTNPVETEHSETVTLLDGGNYYERDVDPQPIDVAGWDIDVMVHTDAAESTIAEVPTGEVVTTATITTDANGQAVFSYTGPEDPDTHQLRFEWNGEGDFDTWHAAADATKIWSDDDATPDSVELSPAESFNEVGTSHTVTASVEDVFERPVDGAAVTFTVERAGETETVATSTRSTDADGEVSFSYGGPDSSDLDTISASVTYEDENEVEQTIHADDVTKVWYAVAEEDIADGSEVLFIDTDEQIVVVEDADDGEFLLVDYTDGDLFEFDNASVTITSWETSVEGDLDGGFEVTMNTTGYLDAEVDTLIEAFREDLALSSAAFTTQPTDVGQGETFADFEVTVLDQYGDPYEVVDITVTATSDALDGTYTADTDGAGVATFTAVGAAAVEAGTYTITADVDGLADDIESTGFEVTQVVGSVTGSDDQTDLDAGTDNPDVTFTVLDRAGVAIAGQDVTLSQTGGDGTLSDTTLATNVDGEVTVTYNSADTDSGDTVTVTGEADDGTNVESADVTLAFAA